MSLKKIAVLFAVACSALSFSETHITADLTTMTFFPEGNPFIVEKDISIPEGSSVVVKSGCIFLFKEFTGISVRGKLAVEGTREQPVVFSSINDSAFHLKTGQLPNPFDWNGIFISRDAGAVSLKYFELRFSVFGIKTQKPDIIIDNGLFRQNGQFHFTVNNKIQFVQDKIPYSYDGPAEKISPVKPPKPSPQAGIEKPKTSNAKKIIRYTSLGLVIVGGVAGIAFGVKANDILHEWREKENDPSWDVEEYNKYKKYYNLNLGFAVAGGVIGVIGLTGFGLTFAF